jgi:hypothetical protein
MTKKNFIVCFICLFVFFQMLLFPCDCPSNCANWRLVDIPEDPWYYMWDVASCYVAEFVDRRWIAVGSYGRCWLFSDDGSGDLTYTSSIEFPNHARTITAKSGFLLRRYVVAGHGGFISTSDDVINWQEETSPVTTDLYAGVYNSDADKVVLVGQSGKVVAESPTGWVEVANAGTSPIWNITYGNGKYVVCNALGWVYTSTDLTSWTRGVRLDCVNAQTAVFGNGVYLIGGKTKTNKLQVVYRSTDTINWTQHIMPWTRNTDYVYDLVYIDSETGPKFIGVAGNRWIIESGDGITWTKKYSPAYPRIMFAIAYSCDDRDIMAVGGYNSIYSECTQ